MCWLRAAFSPTNDWSIYRHGENYRNVVRGSGAVGILRRLEDDLGPSRRAIDEAFARRYGWDEPARVAALYRATPAADDVTLLHAGLPFGARMVGMGVGYVPRYAVDQDATFKEPLIAGASRCPWLLAP